MKLWKSLNRRGRNPLSRQETDDMKVHRKTVGEGNCVSWLWWLFDYTFLLKLLTAPEKGKRLLWMLHYFDGYLNKHRPTHGSFSWLSFPPSLPQDLQWQGQALALLPLAALALRWVGRCRPPPGGPTSPAHPKRHSGGGYPTLAFLRAVHGSASQDPQGPPNRTSPSCFLTSKLPTPSWHLCLLLPGSPQPLACLGISTMVQALFSFKVSTWSRKNSHVCTWGCELSCQHLRHPAASSLTLFTTGTRHSYCWRVPEIWRG